MSQVWVNLRDEAGIVNIRLPHIDANKFSRGFLLRKMRQSASEEVWPLLGMIGADRFKQLIDSNKSFVELVMLSGNIPESWKFAIPQAKQFSSINNIITDEDWVFLLPDWLAALVNRDSKSKAWFMAEVVTIKKMVFGG